MRSRIILLALIVAGAVVLAVLARRDGRDSTQLAPSHSSFGTPRFVGRSVCAECHAYQHAQWTGSHHDLAMAVASEETVLGDFDDATFTHFGVTSTFFESNGKFYVRTDGADGRMTDFEVKYTFGVEPLQQYLLETNGGRLQSLTIAWDTNENRWFHLHPEGPTPHDDPLHWTGLFYNWNARCAECHSTNLQRNYDPATGTYNTTWSEIDVSCEACHGPGSDHVERARAVKASGGTWSPGDDKGLLAMLEASGHEAQVEACARCHARRHAISGEYRYGGRFLDDYVPRLLSEGFYHADGQILEEVYVYGSFLQSKMHARGVRCSDCHDPHTARVLVPGNALCVRCHQPQPPPQFETLPARAYDTPDHHFHKPNTSGSFCVDCHMPQTTYMVVDPRGDHSFRVPRPDLTVKIGTPNACNGCHSDSTAQWAAKQAAQWYPERGDAPARAGDIAEVIAAGRSAERGAAADLAALAAAPDQPGIVRATGLELLRRYPEQQSLSAMVSLLGDADPLVRATAAAGVGALVPASSPAEAHAQNLQWLAPLLNDPIRAVRIEAARVLSAAPADLFDPAQRRAFDAALAEFKAAQHARADWADAHLNLGVVYANMGDVRSAEAAYLTAVQLDEFFAPARFNLANLYNSLGRNDEAEQQLRAIIERTPDEGEAHYSLGLLMAEVGRLEEAARHLGRAADLLPQRARARYNYALALQQLGRRDDAEAALLAAHEAATGDPDIVYAVAVFYMQGEEWARALPYARMLVDLIPDQPGPRELMSHVEKQLER